MTKDKRDFPLQNYYETIYEKYDLVNRIFTFGHDQTWRRKAVRAITENKPESILDICTGTGDLILEAAKNVPENCELAAYDFSAEMLSKAKGKALKKQIKIEFTEGDVAAMPYESNSFDSAGISFGIRNLIYENSAADQHLAEMHRVLKIGGRLVILESSKPGSRVWRFFNNIYLQLILPYLGGIISGNLKAYKYLAQSSKNYYSRNEMSAILEKGGFITIQSQALFLGSVMLMVAEKQDKSTQ
ncbi:MAG: ubiquinone/menaquinone biosynthesis methyltransferase [Bacteroidales bacterium]|jgi:demethylmenaquinone methyltransferase/2-methoxy-6-polyprenyl-1,4-benzoquinol methylase|nr:ubiquinone/menaquinone biosynthesis methyltransferase [Bacteroidales bacterium]